MSDVLRSAAAALAKHTESRRGFLGRFTRIGGAVVAGVTTNALWTTLHATSVSAQGCSGCGGNICSAYVGAYCDYYTGCADGCYTDTEYWMTSGGCWSDGSFNSCCDCICPGNYGPSGCWTGGNFKCACQVSNTAPVMEASRALIRQTYSQPR